MSKAESPDRQPTTQGSIAPSERMTKLRRLMEFNPDTYEQMLQYFRLGATIGAVTAALGIRRDTFNHWMEKGRQNKTGSYAKFYADVHKAIGHAAVLVESDIKVSQPMAWLKNGPRRVLDDEWREGDNEVTVNHVGSIEHDHYDGRAPADDETLAAALIELRNAGLVEFQEGMLGSIGKVVDGSVSTTSDNSASQSKDQ